MKIIFDKVTKHDTILLEQYSFKIEDSVRVQKFVEQALATPETIGGIYWEDMKGMNHSIEVSNQTLYTLLFTFYYLSRHVPININYDNYYLNDNMLSPLLGKPLWLIKLLQVVGLLQKRYTYADLIKVANEQPIPKPLPVKP